MKRFIAGSLILAATIASTAAIADPHFGGDRDEHSQRHDRQRDGQHWQRDGRSQSRDERGDQPREFRRNWERGDREYSEGRRWDHGNDRRYDFDRERDYRWAPKVYIRPDYAPPDYPRPDYARPYYGSYGHQWQRGERLPAAYCQHPYVIEDFSEPQLYVPPRGYHWVRVDGDAVLAAVATGIVLDAVFHVF